jgi:hypothetical protein
MKRWNYNVFRGHHLDLIEVEIKGSYPNGTRYNEPSLILIEGIPAAGTGCVCHIPSPESNLILSGIANLFKVSSTSKSFDMVDELLGQDSGENDVKHRLSEENSCT